MTYLLILNDPPYGTERTYNGLRLAGSLGKQPDTAVNVFLMGDAAAAAKRGQTLPNGFYNLERMISVVVRRGGAVGVCGSCMDARGLTEGELVAGAHRSSMDELTRWTMDAEKLLVF
jgi:uncharacterized protein involved in oxidation of intracellular sulfur